VVSARTTQERQRKLLYGIEGGAKTKEKKGTKRVASRTQASPGRTTQGDQRNAFRNTTHAYPNTSPTLTKKSYTKKGVENLTREWKDGSNAVKNGSQCLEEIPKFKVNPRGRTASGKSWDGGRKDQCAKRTYLKNALRGHRGGEENQEMTDRAEAESV